MEDIINQHQQSIRQNISNSLTKGHVVNNFMHTSNPIMINKTGKQLIEALKNHKSTCQAKCEVINEKINQNLQQCSSQPTNQVDKYIIDGFEDRIQTHKVFSHDKCYSKPTQQSSEYVVQSQSKQPQDNQQCSNHNDLVRQHIECQKECLILQTMIDGIDSKQKYSLTPKQAVVIGL